ncbi:hypothetical protein ACHAW6_004460 [Cyclotella cf. meneghiniana]
MGDIGTFKGLLNLARDRVTYAFNCIHDDWIHWPDPDERKKLLLKLKENTFCQIVCRLWMEPFSNWHLNWSVQIKQIITAANMLVALLEMFCMTTNAESEITWQVFQDQCTIAPINALVAIICCYPITNQNLTSVLHALELSMSWEYGKGKHLGCTQFI